VGTKPDDHPSGDVLRWRAEPPRPVWERPGGEAPDRRRLTIAAIAAIVAGLVAVAVPAVFSVGTAIFVGIMLVAASVPIALTGLASAGPARRLLRLLGAVATLAAGVYLLAAPLEGTFTLTVMLVIWFVVVGVVQIGAGIADLRAGGAAYAIAAGAVSLALGLLIAWELPSSADWAIGLLVGLDFLAYGVLALAEAYGPREPT
jgi:uncharacterized membrane protein HdeD (DUF308 family)